MIGLLLGIGLLLFALQGARAMVPASLVRWGIRLFPLVVAIDLVRGVSRLPPTGAMSIVVALLLIGLAAFLLWRWRAGAATREATAKALAQARCQVRRRLPPPAPSGPGRPAHHTRRRGSAPRRRTGGAP